MCLIQSGTYCSSLTLLGEMDWSRLEYQNLEQNWRLIKGKVYWCWSNSSIKGALDVELAFCCCCCCCSCIFSAIPDNLLSESFKMCQNWPNICIITPKKFIQEDFLKSLQRNIIWFLTTIWEMFSRIFLKLNVINIVNRGGMIKHYYPTAGLLVSLQSSSSKVSNICTVKTYKAKRGGRVAL